MNPTQAISSPSQAWKDAPVNVRFAVFDWFDCKNCTMEEYYMARAHFWYDSIQGCYFFTAKGMLLGVEKDGYIHT